MQILIQDLIAGIQPVQVAPTFSVRYAVRAMHHQGVGAVVIVEEGQLLGVFTERDVLRFFGASRRNPDTTDIGDVMTQNPVTISPWTSVKTVRSMMLEKGGHIPVVDDGRVLGVVSLCRLALAG
ncbi:MAG: CBS domain-containing protein [Magnetospirillum sp.]|nr:CBS domain-containing protein [Magnetospirillum sp.]